MCNVIMLSVHAESFLYYCYFILFFGPIFTHGRLETKFTHLRESLEDVGQYLQYRLPACVMLILQLGHHKVQVIS